MCTLKRLQYKVIILYICILLRIYYLKQEIFVRLQYKSITPFIYCCLVLNNFFYNIFQSSKESKNLILKLKAILLFFNKIITFTFKINL